MSEGSPLALAGQQRRSPDPSSLFFQGTVLRMFQEE